MSADGWQVVGRALGWECNCNVHKTAWEHQWHSFIDHLAEGKKPESFFEEARLTQGYQDAKKRATPSPQGWEEEFDKLYIGSSRIRIKDFIRQTRQEAYEEGRDAGLDDRDFSAVIKASRVQALQEAIGVVEEAKKREDRNLRRGNQSNLWTSTELADWLLARLQKLLK